jgi:hypothetical protein
VDDGGSGDETKGAHPAMRAGRVRRRNGRRDALEFVAMSKKLVLMTVDGEQQWHLDGRALAHEPLFMLQNGLEVWGAFDLDGDEPPGRPFFRPYGPDSEPGDRVDVDPKRDEFRRMAPDEKWRPKPPTSLS